MPLSPSIPGLAPGLGLGCQDVPQSLVQTPPNLSEPYSSLLQNGYSHIPPLSVGKKAKPTPGPVHSRGFTNTEKHSRVMKPHLLFLFYLGFSPLCLVGRRNPQEPKSNRIQESIRWAGGGRLPLLKRCPTSRGPAPSPGLPHPLGHQPLPGEEGGGRGEGGREGGREPQRPRPARTPPGFTLSSSHPQSS